MQLFEVRFSLRSQQLQQRVPQATRSLLARVSFDVLASGTLLTMSGTAHSPLGFQTEWHRELRLALLLCVFGLSPASRGSLGQNCAASVRFFRRRSSRTLRAFVSGSPFSVCVEPEASPLHVFFHLSLDLSTGMIFSISVCVKKKGERIARRVQNAARQQRNHSPTN